jgi:hypothetical protein
MSQWDVHLCDEKLWHWIVPQLQVQLLMMVKGAALSCLEPWHEEMVSENGGFK